MDTKEELGLEAEITQHVPSMAQVPSRELVGVARTSAGLAPLLAAAQTAAERAATDASPLIRTGCVQWLRESLHRTDARKSATAMHRLCFALRVVADAAPAVASSALRAALLSGDEKASLARLVTGVVHSTSAMAASPQAWVASTAAEEACLCVATISRHGGGAGAAARRGAGALVSILEAVGAHTPHPDHHWLGFVFFRSAG